MEATLRSGEVQRFRIVPANAKIGFLISPIIQNQFGALGLFGQLDKTQVSSLDLISLRFQLVPFLKMAFRKEIGVRLSYIDLAPSPTTTINPAIIQRLGVLANLRATAPPNRLPRWVHLRNVLGVESPVLFAHAPTILSLDIEQQATEASVRSKAAELEAFRDRYEKMVEEFKTMKTREQSGR